MATEETVELAYKILMQIAQARDLQRQLGSHFGESGPIGRSAVKAHLQLIVLFRKFARSFECGLPLDPQQIAQLQSLFQETGGAPRELNALSKYLHELTDGVVSRIIANGSGTYVLVFDRGRINR